MARPFTFACLALLAIGLAPTLSRADDAADLIKAKGLSASGYQYVLPVEKELDDGVRKLIALKVKVDADTAQRTDLENKIARCKSALQEWDFQQRNLLEQYQKTTDIDQKNNKVAAIDVLESKIKQVDSIETDLETKLNGISNENRDAFVNLVMDLGDKVDKAQADYKALAADAGVKAAIETINKTSRIKMHLGPTTDFVGKAAFLNKRFRKGVSSDVIPIKIEENVAEVDVTINGTVTRSMVLDTGSTMVAITADLAEQLKIAPGPEDPTMEMSLADGKVIELKVMILKSVRVGKFTIKDVQCAVLPKNLVAAEPLLGGSFLQNFIVKIDPKAKELHLSAIDAPAKKP